MRSIVLALAFLILTPSLALADGALDRAPVPVKTMCRGDPCKLVKVNCPPNPQDWAFNPAGYVAKCITIPPLHPILP